MDVKSELEKFLNIQIVEDIDKNFNIGDSVFGKLKKIDTESDDKFHKRFNNHMQVFNKYLTSKNIDELKRKKVFEIYRCFCLGESKYGDVFK